LQESAKVRHARHLEWLEQPKINLEEAKTFHNGEQNKLENIIKNIEPKIARAMETIHQNYDPSKPN
jgi:polyhydroxyalkanoate synthesis regulator phasin